MKTIPREDLASRESIRSDPSAVVGLLRPSQQTPDDPSTHLASDPNDPPAPWSRINIELEVPVEALEGQGYRLMYDGRSGRGEVERGEEVVGAADGGGGRGGEGWGDVGHGARVVIKLRGSEGGRRREGEFLQSGKNGGGSTSSPDPFGGSRTGGLSVASKERTCERALSSFFTRQAQSRES